MSADRAPLRPLRRPVRPRDADAGAGRARGRPGSQARDDPGFRAELDALLRDYVGRPTPLYLAARLSERRRPPDLPQARGPQPHRRAQDQQRARPGAAGQADGQGADHRRDRRRPARRRRRRPRARCSTSSASSTWAPRTCAARSPTSSGWSCSARRVEPVEAGARTLKEAVSAAIRDWVTNVGAHPLHHRLLRRPGAVPGARARPAAGDRRRGARADARARGPAAAAGDRLRRRRLERDRDVHAVRRRRRASSWSASRRRARGSTPAATARR